MDCIHLSCFMRFDTLTLPYSFFLILYITQTNTNIFSANQNKKPNRQYGLIVAFYPLCILQLHCNLCGVISRTPNVVTTNSWADIKQINNRSAATIITDNSRDYCNSVPPHTKSLFRYSCAL